MEDTGVEERNRQHIDLRQLMIENNLETIVLKPQFGKLGVGIQFISRNELDKLEDLVSSQKGDYIVEEHLRQHPELDKNQPLLGKLHKNHYTFMHRRYGRVFKCDVKNKLIYSFCR